MTQFCGVWKYIGHYLGLHMLWLSHTNMRLSMDPPVHPFTSSSSFMDVFAIPMDSFRWKQLIWNSTKNSLRQEQLYRNNQNNKFGGSFQTRTSPFGFYPIYVCCFDLHHYYCCYSLPIFHISYDKTFTGKRARVRIWMWRACGCLLWCKFSSDMKPESQYP